MSYNTEIVEKIEQLENLINEIKVLMMMDYAEKKDIIEKFYTQFGVGDTVECVASSSKYFTCGEKYHLVGVTSEREFFMTDNKTPSVSAPKHELHVASIGFLMKNFKKVV